MKVNRYALIADKVREQPAPEALAAADPGQKVETWYDLEEIELEPLRQFLAPLALHPLLLERCLAPANDPSVLCIDRATLLAFPTAAGRMDLSPTYVTMLLQAPLLITVRHTPVPGVEEFARRLREDKLPAVHHLPQLVYLIIDQLSDVNVDAGMDLRDEITRLAQDLAERPETVSAGDLARLRGRVDGLVSLIENQLYCIAGLSASDNEALQEPHRKAYIQDLASEAEIAQRSAYRLETRMTDLYSLFQASANDRVEKRLRILTIVSATTLPLALLTGMLGMNVGGVPGTDSPYGFLVVFLIMAATTAAELWYFFRRGWFD